MARQMTDPFRSTSTGLRPRRQRQRQLHGVRRRLLVRFVVLLGDLRHQDEHLRLVHSEVRSRQRRVCHGNTDCCSGACISGQCGGTQCLTIGAACPVAGNACCTGNCSGGKCQSISPGASCVTANNVCTSDTQCCSGLCSSGRCALGASYCIQTADICYHANDCCGGVCSAPNGQAVTATNPGVCSQPSSGSINCTGVDGSLCPGGSCGQCCSRLCAPYGPTGVNICQPAQGCRVEGDLCRSNADCCGGAGSGVLGDGEVICSNTTSGGAVGVCLTPLPDGGGVCVPEGDVCHYTASNYTCGVSSARSDCCGPQNPKFDACELDPFGVPRCNAATGASRGDGGHADASHPAIAMLGLTATECCNGNPCVPGAGGQLQCSTTACEAERAVVHDERGLLRRVALRRPSRIDPGHLHADCSSAATAR